MGEVFRGVAPAINFVPCGDTIGNRKSEFFWGCQMHKLIQDLRYAIRSMRKRPGFTLIAVMTLALGIGASTAIFTVVDAGLLRGLPYKSPESLYHIWETTPQKEFAQREFSYPDYQDYQQNQVFEGIGAYTGGGGILSGRGEPERVFAPGASANFFSVLGVEPHLGRTFQPGEDKPGAPRVGADLRHVAAQFRR